MPDPSTNDKKSSAAVYIVAFCALMAALFLIYVILPKIENMPRTHVMGEHLSMALFIASALTLTYEALLENHREQSLQLSLSKTLREFATEVELKNRQNAVISDPRQVMALIYQLVIQLEKIPTLYNPGRDHYKECNFTNNLEYLDALATIHKDAVTEVLREWIEHQFSPVNIKFLASDFIGKYELKELQEALWQTANPKLIEWASITDPSEKSWVLNYLWAYSRCEKPRYKALSDLLLKNLPGQKKDNFVDEWILFVPLQMPDPEFLPMLREYVNSGDRALQHFDQVQKALLALQQNGVEGAARVLKTLEQKRNTGAQGKGASA